MYTLRAKCVSAGRFSQRTCTHADAADTSSIWELKITKLKCIRTAGEKHPTGIGPVCRFWHVYHLYAYNIILSSSGRNLSLRPRSSPRPGQLVASGVHTSSACRANRNLLLQLPGHSPPLCTGRSLKITTTPCSYYYGARTILAVTGKTIAYRVGCSKN